LGFFILNVKKKRRFSRGIDGVSQQQLINENAEKLGRE
jgi:hypothetical protein